MKIRKAFLVGSLAAFPLLTYACGGAKKDGSADSDAGVGGADADSGVGGAGGDGGAGSGGSGAVSCRSDKACTPFDLVCDTVRSTCVECLSEADCDENSLCTLGSCEAFVPCDSSKDCGSDQVCDPDLARCVQCIGNSDCATDEVCSDTICHASCTSDKSCSALDQVCDSAGGFCVDCETSNDCADNQYCTDSHCIADVCVPGEGSCSGDDLLACNAEGSGFDSSTCADGCEEDGAAAACAEPLPSTCAGATGNPCSSIARFVGTQTVDGDPEEFCDIPYKVMTVQGAGFVAGPTGALIDPTTLTTNSQAEIRVGWSQSALHVHVHVVDAYLRTLTTSGQEYNGDNVQLFIQGTATAGGSRLTAAGTYIVAGDTAGAPEQVYMLPEAGANASKFAFVVSTTAPATGYAYASRVTADGYDVEFKYPWPAAVAPMTAESIVSFDLMVGVNDSSTVAGREFEYGLFMDSGASASCGSAKGLWCDNGLWCTPTLAD